MMIELSDFQYYNAKYVEIEIKGLYVYSPIISANIMKICIH